MSATSISLSATSRRRLSRARASNRAFTILLWSAGILALLPLGFILGYVVLKGVGIKKGDDVYARPDGACSGKGTYAEYVVVKETEAALKPTS